MARAVDAAKVGLDMTVIRHFHEAKHLAKLVAYLGGRAFAVSDVLREFHYQAKARPELARLENLKCPQPLDRLPKDLLDKGLEIQQEFLEPGDGELAHLGEIYTGLAASHFHLDMIVTDDRDGLGLASTWNVRAIRGGGLAAEMVVERALELEEGWEVYKLTRDNPKRENYDREVQASRPKLRTRLRRRSRLSPLGCSLHNAAERKGER